MDRKYTDTDVRKDPTLAPIALRYLSEYNGDFEPLVSARALMMAGGRLRNVMIRTVLNCMRHDPSVVNLPVPVWKTFDASRPRRDPVPPATDPDEDWSGLDEEEEFVPPPSTYKPVQLPLKWKVQFGVSNSVQAKLIHILDQDRSSLTWYPLGTTGWPNKEYIWRVLWACKPTYQAITNPYNRIFLFNGDQVEQAFKLNFLSLRSCQMDRPIKTPMFREWKLCPKCAEILPNTASQVR